MKPVSDVAFTPAVKAVQERLGSRAGYARMEQGRGWNRTITEEPARFIAERDSFYLGTASADGQPYIQHRGGSRSGEIPFDWNDPTTWEPALAGVHAAYVVYTPDLAVPAAPPAIREFTRLAVESGVKKLVLLSGRGEEEAQRCERIVQESGVDWTIVRASWFDQNFTGAWNAPERGVA